MRPAITITPGPVPQSWRHGRFDRDAVTKPMRRRMLAVALVLTIGFGVIGAQLIRLGVIARQTISASRVAPLSQNWARPEIVDRKGRLLAADVLKPSLFADPALIIDLDEVVEKLTLLFPDMKEDALRAALEDRRRRFVWLARGISPRRAQAVHDLGLPGLRFRDETRRVYPGLRLAGQVLGHVNVDNKGMAGIERYIDEEVGVESVLGSARPFLTPVVLSLDIGVQQAMRAELAAAMKRYAAKGAAGVVLDVTNGEILAAVSLPGRDPNRPAEALQPGRRDKLTGGTYELGSIFKAMTVAMALDNGRARLGTTYDVTRPPKVGRRAIRDVHAAGRPLAMAEIFLRSSNVGAALIALDAGAARQQQFLQTAGLLEPMRTEAGWLARPVLPRRWGADAVTTIAYGHGLAVAPLQFAAAAAALVNGGTRIWPSFILKGPRDGATAPLASRVVSPGTSAQLRDLMRLNVTSAIGTGRRADAAGYRVGGKTGTAEIPVAGGYDKNAVIASFLAAFPMDAPKYLTLVLLFEPQATLATRGTFTASVNAAPTTARLVARIAPLLGVLPRRGPLPPAR